MFPLEKKAIQAYQKLPQQNRQPAKKSLELKDFREYVDKVLPRKSIRGLDDQGLSK